VQESRVDRWYAKAVGHSEGHAQISETLAVPAHDIIGLTFKIIATSLCFLYAPKYVPKSLIPLDP
jgi:hypothetical protein